MQYLTVCLLSESLGIGPENVQGKCMHFIPLQYMVMIQMSEFKHELSLLILTNKYNTIWLFSDIPCVFVFMKYVSNFFTKLKSINSVVETFARTNV